MKILITGASGLLGSKVVEIISNNSYEVFPCYYSHPIHINNAIKLNLIDKDSLMKVMEKVRPDVIIHSAALTDVDLCEKEKELALKINSNSTELISNYAKKLNAYLIYVSSDYVFDGEKGNYKEEDEPNPINFYGYTKLLGEIAVSSICNDYLIVRTSVIYGSKPARDKINFALWVLDKLSNNKKIKVLVDQFVSPTLNTNLAEMLLEAIERRLTGICHMSGATRISRYDFAKELAKVMDLNVDLIEEARMQNMNWAAKRLKDSSLNVEKAKSTLNTKPLEIGEATRRLKMEVESYA